MLSDHRTYIIDGKQIWLFIYIYYSTAVHTQQFDNLKIGKIYLNHRWVQWILGDIYTGRSRRCWHRYPRVYRGSTCTHPCLSNTTTQIINISPILISQEKYLYMYLSSHISLNHFSFGKLVHDFFELRHNIIFLLF